MTRQERIILSLEPALNPSLLEVYNESNQHNVPMGSETHFKVIAVANQFHGMARVARHRLVNQLLADELKNGLHALSLHLYSPEEWEKVNSALLKSPKCRGGLKQEERDETK